MASSRNINYTGKDFNSFRKQLVEFSKNYFPDTYSDFSATSPGMMFMEMAAYVGDVLSFYQDVQVQETYLQYAKNPANLYALAYMTGYKPKATSVAEVNLTVTQEIDAVGSTYEPDWNQVCRISDFSSIKGDDRAEIKFLLRDPVDFSYSSSYDPTEVKVASLDKDGNPEKYHLVKNVKAFSGEIKTKTVAVGSYQKYFTFNIEDSNIVGILDIVDSDGNVWTEVPFLGQDTVFVDEKEKDSGTVKVPYVLSLEKVPRRFVTRLTSKGVLQVQFGAGMSVDDADQEYLPNPISLESDIQELSADRFDQAYDPSNFLFSKSYGLAPVNTILTVRYIVGGGVKSNVLANTLTRVDTLLVSSKNSAYEVDPTTISFTNREAASGGRDGDTVEEVRQNAMRAFAEQKRVVTLNDFNVRALSMPPRYGVIAKAHAVNESLANLDRSMLERNPLAVTLYVLGEDINGKLTTVPDLVKGNLRTYMSNYLMVTDAIEIKDAFIINIGVQYDIVVRPNYQNTDVLLKCNRALQDYFETSKRRINEPINISDIFAMLDQVPGVQTVKDVRIINKVGEDNGYSKYAYDISSATRNRVLYPSYDPCIFELKYPNIDIEGRVTTL